MDGGTPLGGDFAHPDEPIGPPVATRIQKNDFVIRVERHSRFGIHPGEHPLVITAEFDAVGIAPPNDNGLGVSPQYVGALNVFVFGNQAGAILSREGADSREDKDGTNEKFPIHEGWI